MPALAGQALVGAALGVVWYLVAPRPAAEFSGLFWYAADDYGFSAGQDVWFALLGVPIGIAVGVALLVWSARPLAFRRALLWLSGCVLGTLACYLVGCLLGGGFATYAAGQQVTMAPVSLTSYGLMAVWTATASLTLTLGLVIRSLFGTSW
jgi:hypothetical protein